MRIVSWNINGIRAVHRKGLFLPFIEELKPDVVCLQETKAEQFQAPVDLPDYQEFWNSAERKGYSGTAIMTKIKPESVALGFPDDLAEQYGLKDDGYGDPNKEGRIVTAEYASCHIVTVYTPNAKEDLSRLALRHAQWDPAFLAYMRRLEEKKPVIFGGDLNVAHTPDDLARPKENEGNKGFTREEREGIQAIVDAGFVDTFRVFTQGNGHYTWWSHFAQARARNIGWRIDYIFISPTLLPRLAKAEIHSHIMGSDHCPISIDIDLEL